METLALLTHVTHSQTNAYTLELLAEITTCVLLEDVSTELVIIVNKETVTTTMFALKTVATHNSDANTNKRIAKMETDVLLTSVHKIKDASTSTNHAMTRTHVLLILAILLLDNVYLLQNHAQTLMHVPLITVMLTLETVSTVSKTVMTTMHAQLMLAM
jgi:hypothetical protein